MSEPNVRGAALWSMAAQYAAFVITFVTGVLISRFFLGPEEVGLFSIAMAAAMLVSVLQDFGITRYVAGEPELGPDKIRACFSISLVAAFAIGLVVLALAWPVAAFYGDPRLAPVVAVIAASYLLTPFGIVPAALLQRRMDFRSLFVVNVGAALAMGGTALGTAAAGWGALSLAFAILAQNGVRALLATALSGERPHFPLRFAGARPILGFGGVMSALYVSGAVGTRTPDLIVGRLVSIAATGLYSRASSLAGQLVTLLTGAVGAVFYPAFARLRDRGEDLAPPYLRVVSGYTAVTWPAMAFLAAAALPIVLLLYGERWADVAPLLALIALSEFFFTALPLQLELPILLGRLKRLFWLNLLDTAISIGLLVLGALWSLEAAAFSRIAYGLAWWFIYAWLLRDLIGLKWRALFDTYLRSLAVSGAAVAPLGAIYLFAASAATIPATWLLAATAAGALCWFGALYAVRHPVREEIGGFVAVILRRPAPPAPARTATRG
jgi:O-antigen/teichoic acid export membrane protein